MSYTSEEMTVSVSRMVSPQGSTEDIFKNLIEKIYSATGYAPSMGEHEEGYIIVLADGEGIIFDTLSEIQSFVTGMIAGSMLNMSGHAIDLQETIDEIKALEEMDDETPDKFNAGYDWALSVVKDLIREKLDE